MTQPKSIKELEERKNEAAIKNGQLEEPSKVASLPNGEAKKFAFNIFPKNQFFSQQFSQLVDKLEISLGMPVWFLVQNDSSHFNSLDSSVTESFCAAKTELKKGEPIALIVESFGGSARDAYKIALLLRRRCGGFTAVIPKYAKSAATLLSLGANKIIMSENAELGPLDVQIYDEEREKMSSALDEVQALQRLHVFALESFDRSMMLIVPRTGKKIDMLLPPVLRFVTDLTEPLINKIDAIHYSQMARALKVGEEYAARLLQPKYSKNIAQKISRHLVENYPEHGFVIDSEEANRMGLETCLMTEEQEAIFETMAPDLRKYSMLGKLIEVS
ncbi:MAG: hypothetical protein PHN49_01745 [Candidatus Omnitrophica bacterium]|nr:hypothetical protein [Candidatus Omnitrophota bacterium]MDD5670342.1 hypothetical protein [Candidatus Omnitrophota bacterium]